MEENGRLIKFLYNEDREVVAEETSNGTITRYIRGLGIISSDSEEAKTYYHYVSDEQGSITHVLSEDAEILNHYSYDAGNLAEDVGKAGKGLEGAAKGAESAAEDAGKVVEWW